MCQFNTDLIYNYAHNKYKIWKINLGGKQDSYILLTPAVLKSDLAEDNECGNWNEKGSQTGLWVIKGGHEFGWIGNVDMVEGEARWLNSKYILWIHEMLKESMQIVYEIHMCVARLQQYSQDTED